MPKKGGGGRCCVDYRELNKVTVPEPYPQPRIDDLLQDTKKAKFMTTPD